MATHPVLNEIKRLSARREGWTAGAPLVIGENAEATRTTRLVPTPAEY